MNTYLKAATKFTPKSPQTQIKTTLQRHSISQNSQEIVQGKINYSLTSLDNQNVLIQREKVKFSPFRGRRFIRDQDGRKHGRKIKPNDIAQGSTGDCYLLSAMASVARANPRAIKKLIKYKGRNRRIKYYDITFYNHKKNYKSPKTIRINNIFPTKNGNPIYAGAGDKGKELWVMLIEKAYVKYKGEGKYDRITKDNYKQAYEDIRGGSVYMAIGLLTGRKPKLDWLKNNKTKQLKFKIRNALKNKQPIAVGISKDHKPPTSYAKVIKIKHKREGKITERKRFIVQNKYVMYPWHIYSVLGIKNNSVTLLNPHARKSITIGKKSYKGGHIFKLPINVVKGVFSYIAIGKSLKNI